MKKRSIGIIGFGIYFLFAGLQFIFFVPVLEKGVFETKKATAVAFKTRISEFKKQANSVYKDDLEKLAEIRRQGGFLHDDFQNFVRSPLPYSFALTESMATMNAILFVLTGIFVLMLRPIGRVMAIGVTAVSWTWTIPLSQAISSDLTTVKSYLNRLLFLTQQLSLKVDMLMVNHDQEILLLVKVAAVNGLIIFLITWWFFTRPKVKEQFAQR